MSADPVDRWAEALFQSARAEQPSAETRERALAGVLALRPGRWRRPLVMGLSALAAAASVTLVDALWRDTDPPPPIEAEAPRAVPSPPAQNHALRGNVPPTSSTRPVIMPVPSSAPAPAPAPAPSAHSKPAPQARVISTLESELAALDQVRAELSRGNMTAAIAELDQYDRQFRRGGSLGAEATRLRLEALSKAGRAREARDLASRFIASDPDNPLVDRARAYLQESPVPRGSAAPGR
jgi:hypothetical protein